MAVATRQGPFAFDALSITTHVTEKSSGSFILGHLDENNTFIPRFVGRSEADVRGELLFQLRLGKKCNAFTFRYASSPHQAFEQQCMDFHECGGCASLDNARHPSRPSHTKWECPICGFAFL